MAALDAPVASPLDEHMDADRRTGRNLVVAVPKPLAEDPQITVGALRWVLDQAVQPDDVVHIVHIVNCLVQKLEVYHGVPGTSFSFQDPGGIHHEHEDIARAKAFLAKSVIPILDAQGVHHRTHLAAETVDAPASAIAQIIFDVAEREKADLVVLGANRKPVSAGDASLGKVARYALDNLQRPLVLVRAFQPVPAAM